MWRFLARRGLAREIEELWSKVSSNLAAGNLRLVFVADAVPDELARVVEFLNRHMDIGQGESYREALEDVQSAITFHVETFGPDAVVDGETPIVEVFVAEAIMAG